MKVIAIVSLLFLAACAGKPVDLSVYTEQEISLQRASGNPIYR